MHTLELPHTWAPFNPEKWLKMIQTMLADTWGLPRPHKYLLQWREPAIPPVRGCGPWHTLRAAGFLWPLTFRSKAEAWAEACRRDPPEMGRNYAGRVEQRYEWRVKGVAS